MTNSPMRRSPRFGGGMVPHRAQSSISPSFALNVDSAPRPPVLVATIPQFNQNITVSTSKRAHTIYRSSRSIWFFSASIPLICLCFSISCRKTHIPANLTFSESNLISDIFGPLILTPNWINSAPTYSCLNTLPLKAGQAFTTLAVLL